MRGGSASPKYSVKLFAPFLLFQVEPFLRLFIIVLFGYLGMSVAFRVSGTCDFYSDSPFIAEIPKRFGNKLRTVIGDDFIWETVPTYDVFPDEVLYYSRCDVLKCFSFYPFGEVVCQNQKKSEFRVA